jgi:hypothetical protein
VNDETGVTPGERAVGEYVALESVSIRRPLSSIDVFTRRFARDRNKDFRRIFCNPRSTAVRHFIVMSMTALARLTVSAR